MDKILNMAAAVEEGGEGAEDGGAAIDAAFNLEELIFEEVVDEERSMINAVEQPPVDHTGTAYNQLADEQESLPEIRLKEDLHSLLIASVCELKERIQENTIEFKLLRAIHIL